MTTPTPDPPPVPTEYGGNRRRTWRSAHPPPSTRKGRHPCHTSRVSFPCQGRVSSSVRGFSLQRPKCFRRRGGSVGRRRRDICGCARRQEEEGGPEGFEGTNRPPVRPPARYARRTLNPSTDLSLSHTFSSSGGGWGAELSVSTEGRAAGRPWRTIHWAKEGVSVTGAGKETPVGHRTGPVVLCTTSLGPSRGPGSGPRKEPGGLKATVGRLGSTSLCFIGS